MDSNVARAALVNGAPQSRRHMAGETPALLAQATLPLLVALVYLNVSAVLVRQYGVPSVLRLVFLALVVIALAEGGIRVFRDVVLQPLPFLLGGYATVLLLTTTFARDPGLADQRVLEALKSFGIFLLIVTLATSYSRMRYSAYALVASATLLSILGIWQTVTGRYRYSFGGFARVKQAHLYDEVFQPRIAGPLGDPNFFAQILLIAVPVALFIGWELSRHRMRMLAFGSAGIIVAATLLTYSRGGMLALAVILVLALIAHRVDKRRMFIGAAAVLILLLLLPPTFTRRFVTIEQILPGSEETLHPDASFQKRRLLTAAAWEMFKEHPLLGVGAGNYTIWFDEYAEQVGSAAREYDQPGEQHFPHSLYLEIAAETGIAGLTLFAASVLLSLVYFRRASRALTAHGEQELAGLAKAFELALIGYLVSSLFLHGHFQRYLWLLFAFAAAFARLASPRRAEDPL